MKVSLPLETMSIEDKLRVMDDIWEDIVRGDSDFPSPDWHGRLLAEREERLRTGTSAVLNWDETKDRLRQKCNAHKHS